jgi:hypothetical protein
LNQIITIKKDPVLLIYAGAVLLLVGSLGFVPFKFPQWQNPVYFFNLTFFSGILILLRCFQKIGWRLSLKGNVLYYQKFNLFSSWKKRRSAEFSLPIENITSARVKKNVIQIKYKPNREIQFKTKGMNPGSRSNLHPLLDALNEDI